MEHFLARLQGKVVVEGGKDKCVLVGDKEWNFLC